MRIRGSAASSVSPSPALSASPSSCSSSSSCFSSSHSTISTHSPTSSSNSTSSSSSPSLSLSSSSSSRRCQGLDLLVKAVYYVAGSVVGVPYIQKRVIRRRKPALRFTNLVINSDKLNLDLDLDDNDNDDVLVDCTSHLVAKKKMKNNKQNRRSKNVPLKYHDSVLQSLKPKDNRRRRRSSKV